MLNEIVPHTGSLLVSEPFMMDPNFKRSVVLLADHSEEGTVGYVLNQKSDFLLRDIFPECPDSSFPVYVGGPVGTDTLHFIHRSYDRMHSGVEIGKDMYWGGNLETLKLLVNRDQIDENEIRFFIGYSGWSDGQLKRELQQNSWLVTDNYVPGSLFTNVEDTLWRDVVIALGPKYSHIANFPENPLWN